MPISYTPKRIPADFRCSGNNLLIEHRRHMNNDRELEAYNGRHLLDMHVDFMRKYRFMCEIL